MARRVQKNNRNQTRQSKMDSDSNTSQRIDSNPTASISGRGSKLDNGSITTKPTASNPSASIPVQGSKRGSGGQPMPTPARAGLSPATKPVKTTAVGSQRQPSHVAAVFEGAGSTCRTNAFNAKFASNSRPADLVDLVADPNLEEKFVMDPIRGGTTNPTVMSASIKCDSSTIRALAKMVVTDVISRVPNANPSEVDGVPSIAEIAQDATSVNHKSNGGNDIASEPSSSPIGAGASSKNTPGNDQARDLDAEIGIRSREMLTGESCNNQERNPESVRPKEVELASVGTVTPEFWKLWTTDAGTAIPCDDGILPSSVVGGDIQDVVIKDTTASKISNVENDFVDHRCPEADAVPPAEMVDKIDNALVAIRDVAGNPVDVIVAHMENLGVHVENCVELETPDSVSKETRATVSGETRATISMDNPPTSQIDTAPAAVAHKSGAVADHGSGTVEPSAQPQENETRQSMCKQGVTGPVVPAKKRGDDRTHCLAAGATGLYDMVCSVLRK